MAKELHKIEGLEIEAEWTEEKSPQLKDVEITQYENDQGFAIHINPKILPDVINILLNLNKDKITQENLKRRTR